MQPVLLNYWAHNALDRSKIFEQIILDSPCGKKKPHITACGDAPLCWLNKLFL